MSRFERFFVITVTTAAALPIPMAHAEEASPVTAAVGLATRLFGDGAQAFSFETIASENGTDVFEVEAHDGRATIRGSSGVAMASGLNWYLKYHCNRHVSWCGDQLALPDPLPSRRPRKWVPYGTPHIRADRLTFRLSRDAPHFLIEVFETGCILI